jgi:serine protease Do
MLWKKTGLISIVLAALAIAGYAQSTKPRGHSTNLQGASQGYLGAGVQVVDDSDVKTLKLKDNIGVKVTSVTPGTAAAAAGLHTDDVILEIDGQKATDAQDFQDSIIGKAPGSKINLTIWRMGVKLNIVATLGTRPFGLPLQEVPVGSMPMPPVLPQDLAGMAAAMGSVVAPRLGFDFVEVMPQLADFFGVMGGVLVENVSPRSAAGKAGLKAGDIVTKVNGTPVADPRDVVAIIRQSGKKQVTLTVMRNKKEVTLSMELSMSLDPFFRQPVN